MDAKRLLQLLNHLPVIVVVGIVLVGVFLLASMSNGGQLFGQIGNTVNNVTDAEPRRATPQVVLAPTPLPTAPVQPTPTPMPPMTVEEELKWRERIYAEAEARGDRSIRLDGPHTAGSQIQIAGKAIQLPADAFVAAHIAFVSWPPGQPPPQTPIVAIQRKNSFIWVSEPSGVVVDEVVAPGEEGAFDFLKAALR